MSLITKDRAIELALIFLELESELQSAYPDGEFETHRFLYEFIDLKDVSHKEKFEQIDIIENVLRRFLQEQETVDEVKETKARDILVRLSGLNVDESEHIALDDHQNDLQEAILWDWWGPKEHVQRYLSAKPLVAIEKLPGRLKDMVTEARQCYAFAQLDAVMALGRMIIEFAITDIGFRIGRFPAPKSLEDYYDAYPPRERADLLLGKTGPRRNKFRELYNEGSHSIHSSEDADSSVALNYLRDILEFV